MFIRSTLMAAVAAAALTSPVLAAEADSDQTNATTHKAHSDTLPETGVNVGDAALGKNTVSKKSSKVGTRARGYDHNNPASDGLPVGGSNADPGTKGREDEDRRY